MSLVFDSSSIISISLNNLIPILEELKKSFQGEFIIPKSVKKEIIDTPLKTKKFKLEAIMLSALIGKTFKVYNNIDVQKKAIQLQNLANNCFQAKGKPLKLVDLGEMESLAIALFLKATYVVDERTTRLLVECPRNLNKLLTRKFHSNVTLNKLNLEKFTKQVQGVTLIRSSELMTVAYEKGLFSKYKNKNINGNFPKQVLEAILWGLRLRGCAISTEEINEILTIERV